MAGKTILVFTKKGKVVDICPCKTTKPRTEIMDFINQIKNLFEDAMSPCIDCQGALFDQCETCEKKNITVNEIYDTLLRKKIVEELNDKDYIRVINNIEIGK